MPAPRTPRKILSTTDTVSAEFRLDGGVVDFLFMTVYAGGSWTLQAKHPARDDWISLDGAGGVTFNSTGLQALYGSQQLTYRLAGGAVGAEAWTVAGDRVPLS